MTVIAGLIITLAIPLIDVIWGRYLRANPPAFGSGRFSFRTKRAKKDEEVWAFANNLFAHMIMVTGVNTGIAATIFYFGALVITGDNNWAAASLSLFAVQAVCILISVPDYRLYGQKNIPPCRCRCEYRTGRKGRAEKAGESG